MNIQTERFGEIEVDETKALELPDGLPGFEEARRFILLPHGEYSPFYFLQSLEQPELAFVVTCPRDFFPQYQPVIPAEELQELDLEADKEPADILVILTVPADPRLMTANLLAPLVINVAKQRVRQVILNGSGYQTRHRIFPDQPQLQKTAVQGEKQPTQVCSGV